MQHSEAVVQRCSIKMVFLKISLNLLENSCVGVSFLVKLQAWGLKLRLATLLKKTPWHWRFPSSFEKYLTTLFYIQHLRLATSEHCHNYSLEWMIWKSFTTIQDGHYEWNNVTISISNICKKLRWQSSSHFCKWKLVFDFLGFLLK